MSTEPNKRNSGRARILETRFQLLIDAVIDYAIYMVDPSGLVATWNSGAQRIKGYTADEIIGRHFSCFFTEEDRRIGFPQQALDTARRQGRFESEGWRVRKDGGRFWASAVIDAVYDDTGELIGFAKITRDITERRNATLALEESERQLRLLVSGIIDYALFMLDPSGIVTNWNPGAERIKGYRSYEVIGQHFSKFYTPADRAAGLPIHALNTAAREGRYEAEGLRLRKDGTEFWAHVIIDAIRDDTGKLIGFGKVTRDITELRNASLALQQAQEQLLQSQKLEALGHLTGGVADDFNNLLMIVSGHAQAIRRQQPGDKAVRSVDAIETAVRRGANLTRQLLTFSRYQPLSQAAIDLGPHLRGIAEMLKSSSGSSIDIAIQVPDQIWPVMADVGELDLALLDLVLNARDAMPDGGTITLSAVNVPGGTTSEADGDQVGITVADQGVGIPPDILSKVFDPFFTTNEPGRGSGLGLSQVYGFARQSGGRVEIRSELGRGTSVTIFLPSSKEEAAGENDKAQAKLIDKGGTALLVEDNLDVAHVTTTLLEQIGYRCKSVLNADAALELLEEGERFDLVFSDIVMAGRLNGLALARIIRERFPDVPVVLATGYSEAAGQAQKEFIILRKPYVVTDLQKAVANAVAERDLGKAG
jgi:PAS domain S-box-containing protein